MIHVVLVEPEIPPNTGNIARTCAATGTPLHLVEPLGFSISDKHVRRAGLDYWSDVEIVTHRNVEVFLDGVQENGRQNAQLALMTTKGSRWYTEIPDPTAATDLYLVFGPETRGLSDDILARYPDDRYRIPMKPGQRSLNLGNAAAVVLYDLLRRNNFDSFR